jgi:hypothetical protein
MAHRMLVDRKGGSQSYVFKSSAVYIIDTPQCVYIWKGAHATNGHKTVTDFTVKSFQVRV